MTSSIKGAQLQDPVMRPLLAAMLADFQALRVALAGVLVASATLDVASLADGVGATATVTVPGALLGDFAFVSMGLDTQGITVTAYVSAANVVSARFQNESGATVDLVSTTIRAFVIPLSVNTRSLGVLEASATVDVASLVDAAGATSTLTVTGAVLGDLVLISHGLDLQGITTTGYVSVADTVAVRFQNETGGTIDLASTTLRAKVIPQALAANLTALGGCLFGSATYDAASLIDGAGATTTVAVQGAELGDIPVVSLGVDLQGISVNAWVSASNVVSVRLQNESGGTLDLASTTLRAMVLKKEITTVAPALNIAA